MKTKEGNKLIAEFMGIVWEGGSGWFCEIPIDGEQGTLSLERVIYHESWDWLMPVVEKIDSILADDDFVTISYNRCMIEVHNPEFIFPDKEVESISIEGFGNTRIEATWNAVCEFIEWYNENK